MIDDSRTLLLAKLSRTNHQAYEDFVYWYNCHAEILKAEVAEGNTPTVPYSDIKYLALEDTVNSMYEALMTA